MSKRNPYLRVLLLLLVLYAFLVSIKLLGTSLKLLGGGFAEYLISTTSNPIVGLFIGILATSIVQSSSSTTSIVVGLVAGGAISIRNAIPIIMGANIGTTVTNIIVSMGHITRKEEIERAFAAATVHDFFNLFTVGILFPLEITFHFLERSATLLANAFAGAGGMKLVSPLKYSVEPLVELIQQSVHSPVVMFVLSLALLFAALTLLVRIIKSLVMTRAEVLLDRFLFKTAATSFLLGVVLTAVIQSSSVTTSLVVPLVGAGILTVGRIYPYSLGANIGTTVTSILASWVTFDLAAVTVAFSHLMFNVLGVAIMYFVLRPVPIWLSEKLGVVVAKFRWLAVVYVLVAFFIIPFLLILLLG